MDLGCLDLGCIEKQKNEAVLDPENNGNESVVSTARVGKNRTLKEAGQSNVSSLNKFTLQIKKPSHRKGSPLNWFPRKKVDSYLKRKIELLQEIGGMNSTLDETLGDSNPHYSRVLREKIAVRRAAHKAMEARKASMVEASWCRILRAARIQSKEAEALLLEAEKGASEAFEAATAIGVIMYDIPDCSQKPYEIETSSANGIGSATHTVAASFETEFEVDKQVAAAVKTAFIKLANCPSINKDEFKEMLRKISQNPDTGDDNQGLSEFSSECESDTGSDIDPGCHKDSKMAAPEARQKKYKKKQSSENFNMTKLVDMMLQRLRCLQEDELASLATIVATCGLNAALAEAENNKQRDLDPAADYTTASALNVPQRMSSFGAGTMSCSNVENFMDGQMRRRKQVEAELPSLDKFLVKHLTKLEREVQDAKNRRRNEAREESGENPDTYDDEKEDSVNISSAEAIPDLGSILVKHSSKFEKEIEEAKKNSRKKFENESKNLNGNINSSEVVPDLGSILTKHSSKLQKEIGEIKRNSAKSFERNGKKLERVQKGELSLKKHDETEVPSLEKYLVKHVSKLEREVQEAKNRRKFEPIEGVRMSNSTSITQDEVGKENIDLNKKRDSKLALEQEEMLTLPPQNTTDCSGDSLIQIEPEISEAAEASTFDNGKDESKETEYGLENILAKPVHQLERRKMQTLGRRDYRSHRDQNKQGGNNVPDCESLDKVLVKHVSRLEKEKMQIGAMEEAVKWKKGDTNRQLDNCKSSLDQILVKHRSRLEREKSNQMAAAQQPDVIKHSVSRREARERELQEAWGGLSLGNSIRPHLSRLERDKAAWLKAEEEERKQAMEL